MNRTRMIVLLILIIAVIGTIAVLARTPVRDAEPEPVPRADTTPPAGDTLTDPASTSP